MKLAVLFSILMSVSSWAASYPVDEIIEAHRAKANYLELMKAVLETNTCSIELGNTSVVLSAEALRSEGVVIAIGDGFKGNFLAYHQAPKPEHLEKVIAVTFQNAAAGKGASIITARLNFNEVSQQLETLQVIVNEPWKEPTSPNLWLYEKAGLALPISATQKISTQKTGTAKVTKRPFTVRCN